MPPDPQVRWVANERLSIERRGEDPIRFEADEECVGAPDNWPPKWLIDQGLVSPMSESRAAAENKTEKGAR